MHYDFFSAANADEQEAELQRLNEKYEGEKNREREGKRKEKENGGRREGGGGRRKEEGWEKLGGDRGERNRKSKNGKKRLAPQVIHLLSSMFFFSSHVHITTLSFFPLYLLSLSLSLFLPLFPFSSSRQVDTQVEEQGSDEDDDEDDEVKRGGKKWTYLIYRFGMCGIKSLLTFIN